MFRKESKWKRIYALKNYNLIKLHILIQYIYIYIYIYIIYILYIVLKCVVLLDCNFFKHIYIYIHTLGHTFIGSWFCTFSISHSILLSFRVHCHFIKLNTLYIYKGYNCTFLDTRHNSFCALFFILKLQGCSQFCHLAKLFLVSDITKLLPCRKWLNFY